MRWISDIRNGKLYGSMVIWVTKRKDAERLMKEGLFQISGEAAYTRPFEKRIGLIRCYNCQKYDHQALRCKEADPTCGKCALKGHSYRYCTNAFIRCGACQGPHEVIDKGCPEYQRRAQSSRPHHE